MKMSSNSYLTKSTIYSVRNRLAFLFLILSFSLFSTAIRAQNENFVNKPAKIWLNLEADPLTWKGVVDNAQRFDARVVFRLSTAPRIRYGLVGYAGKWDSRFGRDLLLTKDFPETNWTINQNGFGIETQYLLNLGSKRGGLVPGLRAQWNQFKYRQNNIVKGEANHLALTPQVGYQWFPFKKLGFYLLPWTSVQIPVAGTANITIDGVKRNTRKIIPWATVLVGWELKF